MPTPLENNTITLQEILDIANNLPSAPQLPTLSNPAGAQNIQSGYEAIDKDGKKITGTHREPTLNDLLPTLTNPAGPEQILKGYQAIGPDGKVIVGTMRLPVGYTELEYIQSDGTQYIDTGFKPNNNTRVVMDIDILPSNGETVPIFGARDVFGSSKNSFCFWRIYPEFRSDYGTKTVTIDVTPSGRHRIDKNKNVITVDGVTVTHANTTFQSNATLVLFSNNSLGSIDDRMVHAKLYSCQVYDNGMLIRDFVPCKNSSGTRGLFDLVTLKFYANTNTYKTVRINQTNIEYYFTVYNGTYYFAGDGEVFASNNNNKNLSDATTRLTAKQEYPITFTYACYTEKGYDKFYIDIDSDYIADGISGNYENGESYSGILHNGSTLSFIYHKDSSGSSGYDQCAFYNMDIKVSEAPNNFAGSDAA